MNPRALHIPSGESDLTVRVVGDVAELHLVPAAPSTPALHEPASIRVSARALVAALRAAWADEHRSRRLEPWREPGWGDRWRDYGGWDDDGIPDEPDDDLGDGDPGGYRDPTVVPFPCRPAPRPAPGRTGHAWESWEHDAIRTTWLAAEPDADKKELIRDLAVRLERGVGGVTARLRLAGCDPTRPGTEWDGTYGGSTAELLPPDGAAVDSLEHTSDSGL